MIHYWRFCAPLFTLSAPCSTLAAASFFVSSAFDEPQPNHELLFSLAFSTVSSAVCCTDGVKGEWNSRQKGKEANLGGIIRRRYFGLCLFVLVNNSTLALFILLRCIGFAPWYFCSAWVSKRHISQLPRPKGESVQRRHEEIDVMKIEDEAHLEFVGLDLPSRLDISLRFSREPGPRPCPSRLLLLRSSSTSRHLLQQPSTLRPKPTCSPHPGRGLWRA
jgi:hypothetical protein